MFVLDRLDATRLCSRWSVPYEDANAWARPIPARVPAPATTVAVDYSWRSLTRNPNALALTGMVGAVMIKDALLRRVLG